MLLFKADLWTEVLTHDALPSWVELFIKQFLEVLRHVDILNFARFRSFLEYVFYGFKSQIYWQYDLFDFIRIGHLPSGMLDFSMWILLSAIGEGKWIYRFLQFKLQV